MSDTDATSGSTSAGDSDPTAPLWTAPTAPLQGQGSGGVSSQPSGPAANPYATPSQPAVAPYGAGPQDSAPASWQGGYPPSYPPEPYAQQGSAQPGYGHVPSPAGVPHGQPQPGSPVPPYGPPPGYGVALGRPYGATSSRATTVLVLGILSIVGLGFCGLGLVAGIVGLALAPGAKREIRASGGALTGEGQVKAGQICAVISLVLGVLAIILWIILVAVGVTSSPSSGAYG